MALFKPATALRAQLSSGYKDTDYAISEIIDNSIEAHAKNIDIFILETLCGEKRSVWKINKIAVLDDGHGMSKDVLGHVLTFGYGTHSGTDSINKDDFGKLGKYGYGLPNASVSQAKIISVWSWQDGLDSAYHSELNVDAILKEDAEEQTPSKLRKLNKSILDMAQKANHKFKKSGTLVLWDDTYKCSWSRSQTLINHLERTVGRIFRKFINNDKNRVNIRVTVFKEGKKDPFIGPKKLRANDPLFLMDNTIATDLLDSPLSEGETIFEPIPPQSISFNDLNVEYKGKISTIKIRYSIVSKSIRSKYPGASELGKLAKDNLGVSICRAGRELELSQTWIHNVDPRHRWWGIEIDFPPALDDIFGVTSNKQSATELENFARIEVDEFETHFAEDYAKENPKFNLSSENNLMSHQQIINAMIEEGNNHWILLEIAHRVQGQIGKMLSKIRKYKEGELGKGKPKVGTNAGGLGEGTGSIIKIVTGEPPALNPKTAETKAKEIGETEGATPDQIEELKKWLLSGETLNIAFSSDFLSTSFFEVQNVYGRIRITLNTNHPIWEAVFEPLKDFIENSSSTQPSLEELIKNYDQLRICLILMLYGWAHMEATNQSNKTFAAYAASLRNTWGTELSFLLNELLKQNKEEGI